MSKHLSLAYRMRNERAAPERALVFIHGAMGQKDVWLPLSRLLAERLPDRRCVLIDLPGHGESPGEGMESMDAYTDQVARFIQSQGLRRPIIVGHSMGGAIAQQLALAFGNDLSALVLLATGARLGVNGQIFSIMSGNYDMGVALLREFIFGPDFPQRIADDILRHMHDIPQTVALADFTACDGFSSIDRLGELRLPAMVCCGSKDLLTSPKKNRQLADALGAPLFELEGAGHMIHVERSEEVADIIAKFVEELPWRSDSEIHA